MLQGALLAGSFSWTKVVKYISKREPAGGNISAFGDDCHDEDAEFENRAREHLHVWCAPLDSDILDPSVPCSPGPPLLSQEQAFDVPSGSEHSQQSEEILSESSTTVSQRVQQGTTETNGAEVGCSGARSLPSLPAAAAHAGSSCISDERKHEGWGVEVRTAGSGANALGGLCASSPEVVMARTQEWSALFAQGWIMAACRRDRDFTLPDGDLCQTEAVKTWEGEDGSAPAAQGQWTGRSEPPADQDRGALACESARSICPQIQYAAQAHPGARIQKDERSGAGSPNYMHRFPGGSCVKSSPGGGTREDVTESGMGLWCAPLGEDDEECVDREQADSWEMGIGFNEGAEALNERFRDDHLSQAVVDAAWNAASAPAAQASDGRGGAMTVAAVEMLPAYSPDAVPEAGAELPVECQLGTGGRKAVKAMIDKLKKSPGGWPRKSAQSGSALDKQGEQRCSRKCVRSQVCGRHVCCSAPALLGTARAGSVRRSWLRKKEEQEL